MIHICNPTAELTIPIGILTKQVKPEIKKHPEIVETAEMYFKAVKTFLCFQCNIKPYKRFILLIH